MATCETGQLPVVSTYLSPTVHTLITEHALTDRTDTRVLDTDGCLDFSYICSKLPAPPLDTDDPGVNETLYFCECVKVLAPMFHSVENQLSMYDINDVTSRYSHLFQWTDQQKLLVEIWGLMYTHNDLDDLLSLLVTTTVLERSLGDVYLISGPTPCPSMLKDLLVTCQLVNLLDYQVVQVLRVLIGPPTSLNIRNIAWHGFPLPGEIPKRCIWFILLLVPSIGQLLHNKCIQVSKHREPVIFPEVFAISELDFFESADNNWPEAVSQIWTKVENLYRQKRYGFCTALLLYHLEQGLRRVFAAANNCQHRVLTAESTTLFTTFDEILNPFLPDGSENRLKYVIGDELTEVLIDLLLYQNGPRVRNRLSHGEADWDIFPRQITDNFVMAAAALSAVICPEVLQTMPDNIQRVKSEISSYKVQFHAISIIKTKIGKCFTQSAMLDGIVHVLPDLSPRATSELYPVTDRHIRLEESVRRVTEAISKNWSTTALPTDISETMLYNGCQQCRVSMDAILSNKIKTLYRGAKMQKDTDGEGRTDREGEILSLLDHVTTENLTVLSNILQFVTIRQQQMADRQLRSRQKENFKKYLNCFPSHIAVTNLYGLLVTWQLYHLDEVNLQTDAAAKFRTRFWKSQLRMCENLRTYTHPEKNKWTEGLHLATQYLDNISINLQLLTQ